MSKQKNYTKSEKELRKRLAEALWENRKTNSLKEKIKGDYEITKKEYKERSDEESKVKRMVLHEIKNPLSNIMGFTGLLREREGNFLPEQRQEFYEIIGKESEKIENIAKILYLDGLSKEDLKKETELFSLEKMAIDYAHTMNSELLKSKIGLNLKYDRPYNQELQIYANKGVFETIWGTLTGNSINFALPETRVKQGIRINRSGNLEIMMENYHDSSIQKRKFAGLGEGLGLDFAKKIVKNLGGSVKIEEKPLIPSTYDVSQKFGYKSYTKPEEGNYGTFAVKLIIPISEISNNK